MAKKTPTERDLEKDRKGRKPSMGLAGYALSGKLRNRQIENAEYHAMNPAQKKKLDAKRAAEEKKNKRQVSKRKNSVVDFWGD